MLYLFDPITGIKTPTTYKIIEGITGRIPTDSASLKCRVKKLGSINSYIVDEKTPKKKLHELMQKEVIINEAWVSIKDSDGSYYISDHGRVKHIYKNGKVRIKIPYMRNKHLNINVIIKGKDKCLTIHSLVAKHFVENDDPKAKRIVFHKNENRFDNYAGNLEWIDIVTLGQRVAGKSKAIAVVKIDPVTGDELDSYISMADAGRKNFLTRQTIGKCVRGETKTAGGYRWRVDNDF